ncbi:MAG: methylthioribulose 1-phosphate dehydratase [Pirellulales bacterium]|nr:methylthioribulose 1-phosphate dehydratase [Pirellulales bacterium]
MNELTSVQNFSESFASGDLRAALCAIGREFHSRGWSLGTSSNYSVVAGRNPLELLITASGKDKSALTKNDFVAVDSSGQLIQGHELKGKKSSAETLLHCLIAKLLPDVGAILHTHSIWGTTLSRQALTTQQTLGAIRIEGYEMLKGLEGITTHDTTIDVPVFQNGQDMVELSDRIREVFISPDGGPSEASAHHGFLLSGHGLYTWGRTLADARRHIEIFEFLFEVTAQQKLLARCT